MRKVALTIVLAFCAIPSLFAQIPYFAGTVGNEKLYAYTSVKFRPHIQGLETYSCFQWGIGDSFAAGTDLYTAPGGGAFWGFSARYGKAISPWFNIGGIVIPSFNLTDKFKYSYTSAAVFMNGQISRNGRFFWCTNTWLEVFRGGETSITNWEYLAFKFPLGGKCCITPLVGATHDWKFGKDPISPAAGFYFSCGRFTTYIWSNDLSRSNPRFILGLELVV